MPAKKKVTETIKISSSSSSSDDAHPGRFTCPARGCQETFASVQERITHARAHELDADQEHLAAYFYCTVLNSGCAYARNIHDDTRAGIVRKDQMGTHMRRARHHGNMTDAERRAERALIVERTRLARINVGLPPITSDHEPLPAHARLCSLPTCLEGQREEAAPREILLVDSRY